MTLSWTNLTNGISNLLFRGNINTFNSNVATQVNQNTTDIATIDGRVTTAEADIDTNTANIATNTANIATNTSDIAAINSKATYDYVNIANYTVVGDTFEEITRLTTPSRDAGTYKVDLSMLSSLNSTTTSAYFRFSIDGGTTWTTVIREPKSTTDIIPTNYFITHVHAGGVFEVIVQGRKAVLADVLVVQALNISFDRKL